MKKPFFYKSPFTLLLFAALLVLTLNFLWLVLSTKGKLFACVNFAGVATELPANLHHEKVILYGTIRNGLEVTAMLADKHITIESPGFGSPLAIWLHWNEDAPFWTDLPISGHGILEGTLEMSPGSTHGHGGMYSSQLTNIRTLIPPFPMACLSFLFQTVFCALALHAVKINFLRGIRASLIFCL